MKGGEIDMTGHAFEGCTNSNCRRPLLQFALGCHAHGCTLLLLTVARIDVKGSPDTTGGA